jgi:translocation and assembly module TamB
MSDETELSPREFRSKRSSTMRTIFGAAILLFAALLAIAYWQRLNLADGLVRDQLKAYDIDAKFAIKDVGLRTQRLENVVIGDPANPDLTADWIELDVAINFSGVTPRDVRASGVRLNGRLKDGKLSFGQLDKFADPASKEPFELPDIALDVTDAQLRLDTPWGLIGAGLDGTGLLRQGFEGNLSVRAPKLDYAGCAVTDTKFDGRYVLDFRQPNLIGPIAAQMLTCPERGINVAQPLLNADVRLSEQFDNWLGDIKYSAGNIAANDFRLLSPSGTLKIDGNTQRTNFDAILSGASFASAPLDARDIAATAKGKIGFAATGIGISSQGALQVMGGALDNRYLNGLDGAVRQSATSPAGPLLAKMQPALRRFIADFDGSMRYDAAIETDGNMTVAFDRMAVTSRSGAKLTQSGLATLDGYNGNWTLGSPVSLALDGGGLPSAALSLRQGRGNAWTGGLNMQKFASGNASLAIPALAFSGTPGGTWRFDGRALLSGPLPDGFVTALNIPIDGQWDGRNFSLYQSCQNVAFQNIRYANLALSQQNIRLCPSGGGSILQAGSGGTRFSSAIPDFAVSGLFDGQRAIARASNVRFNLNEGFTASNIFAEYGNSPIRVKAPALRFSFASGFTSNTIKVEIGDNAALTEFEIARVFGRPAKGGFAGRVEEADGQIANVPLLLDSANGDWTFRGGNLTLSGAMRVSDAAQVDRFQPLNVPDMLVTLENGVINAMGSLHEPKTGRQVAQADIKHLLTAGSGGALLSVDNLRFDEGFQPELITPLTLGVIANSRGVVNGDGRIDWNANGVTSSGRFVTETFNVAAAFGPVENLRTEIVFNDLLGFETGPGQLAQIGSVNPGIAALNGQIRYQLLPGKKIGIEGGTWPFAGGELILEPTVLDFGIDKDRRLTFRVVGMDSAQFLGQYDFQNLQVSGIFDGTLPMVFNQDGGRIVGGSLVSRPGGGQVSYVGELSYKDMGVFANFAFNALKSIRYNELVIGVAGDIDGEIVTEVKFAGLQQGTGAQRNFITKQLSKIPIQFNVTIRAQFLQLISSVRGLYDAEYARDQGLPFLIDKQRGTPPITGEETGATKSEPKDE